MVVSWHNTPLSTFSPPASVQQVPQCNAKLCAMFQTLTCDRLQHFVVSAAPTVFSTVAFRSSCCVAGSLIQYPSPDCYQAVLSTCNVCHVTAWQNISLVVQCWLSTAEWVLHRLLGTMFPDQWCHTQHVHQTCSNIGEIQHKYGDTSWMVKELA